MFDVIDDSVSMIGIYVFHEHSFSILNQNDKKSGPGDETLSSQEYGNVQHFKESYHVLAKASSTRLINRYTQIQTDKGNIV